MGMRRLLGYFVIMQAFIFVKTDCTAQKYVSSLDAQIVATSIVEQRNHGVASTVEKVVLEECNEIPCYYTIIFANNKWVIVSADKRAHPILAYGSDTEFLNNMPDAFKGLLYDYKIKLFELSVSDDTISKESLCRWQSLLSTVNEKRTLCYESGTSLLNSIKRGEQKWRQDKNNSDSCDMAYNKYCPSETSIGSCDCNNTPTGCGAVAMGQVMWYWQWPRNSSYRTYDWDNMPGQIIYNQTSINDADNVAHLLRDCGDASGMTYACTGSWVVMNNIIDAFKNEFNYKTVKKYSKSDWSYGNSWKNLIHSEIDNRRPVIFYADNAIFVNGHYFVCDGYDPYDDNLFKFNFGWGASSTSVVINIGNITYNSHDFSHNNKVIIGLSPSYEDLNIYDVPYYEISHERKEIANRFIELPCSANCLKVNDSANYSLISGKHILLKDGFYAKRGCSFTASVDESISEGFDISVDSWPNAMIIGGNPYWVKVHNADSWEFTVSNINGSVVYQNAGKLTGDFASQNVVLWDGVGANHQGSYVCNVRFKNSYGRSLEKTISVSVFMENKSVSKRIPEDESLEKKQSNDGRNILVSPNPTKGILTISSICEESLVAVDVIDANGNVMFRKKNIDDLLVNMDISHLPNSIYYIRAYTDNNIYVEKVILTK